MKNQRMWNYRETRYGSLHSNHPREWFWLDTDRARGTPKEESKVVLISPFLQRKVSLRLRFPVKCSPTITSTLVLQGLFIFLYIHCLLVADADAMSLILWLLFVCLLFFLSSPLARSKRTAEIIWGPRQQPIIPEFDLREIDLYSFQVSFWLIFILFTNFTPVLSSYYEFYPWEFNFSTSYCIYIIKHKHLLV